MFKKVILAVACIFLLSGCEDGAGSKIKEATSPGQEAKQVVSETALFLPGGAGVDFGRKATSERISTNPDGRRFNILSYDFTEAADEIDASLAGVLQAEGYVRTMPPADNIVLHAVYKKKDYSYVSARYLKQAADVSSKKTTLVLSWEVKP